MVGTGFVEVFNFLKNDLQLCSTVFRSDQFSNFRRNLFGGEWLINHSYKISHLANTQFKQGKLDEAIATYSLALMQDPSDLEAKQNLELCWKIKQEMQQHPDSSKKQQQQQQQQQPQQQPQPHQAQAQPAPKGSIPKEQADRMLQALQSKERENLKKQPKPPQSGAPGGKDW